MTTTFPPEEGSVRNELTLFKGLFGICLIFGIILIVITLSLGYNVCTRDLQIVEENSKSKENWRNTRRLTSPPFIERREEFERVSNF
ncbi:unnamed protein product [Meloidogyne enterolobii]|uniref:Uncharacterized protein n=1 Tax=Meloidogyne enterolobii TaxID=390850 RepID=A0ACB1AHR3_MELEN